MSGVKPKTQRLDARVDEKTRRLFWCETAFNGDNLCYYTQISMASECYFWNQPSPTRYINSVGKQRKSAETVLYLEGYAGDDSIRRELSGRIAIEMFQFVSGVDGPKHMQKLACDKAAAPEW